MFKNHKIGLFLIVIVLFATGCENKAVSIIENSPVPTKQEITYSSTSKEEVIYSIKNIGPFVYKDVGTAFIPYEERRDNIIAFMDNLKKYLENENASIKLSDKDYEDIFNVSVRSKTSKMKLKDDEINLRLITYNGVGSPNIYKYWGIVQWWSKTEYGVQFVRQESINRVDDFLLQNYNDNLYVMLFGNAKIEVLSLTGDRLNRVNALKSYDAEKFDWHIKNENNMIAVCYGDGKPVYTERNKNGNGVIVYENVKKETINFQFKDGVFTLAYSNDISKESMDNYVKGVVSDGFVKSTLSGVGMSESYYKVNIVYNNDKPETYIRETAPTIINYFFSNYQKSENRVENIKLVYQKHKIDERFSVVVYIDAAGLKKFMDSKQDIDNLLRFGTISSYYNDTINPGLILSENNTDYLTGEKALNIALEVARGGNHTGFEGFTCSNGKVFFKYRHYWYSEGADSIHTIAWIDVDASNGKAFDVTWGDPKPLN